MINFLKNIRSQESGTMWLIIGAIVLVLALVLIFLLTGKISNLGNAIIKSFG